MQVRSIFAPQQVLFKPSHGALAIHPFKDNVRAR